MTMKCPLCCNKQFSSRQDLKLHLIQISYLLNSLKCSLCSENFITLQDLIEHLKVDCQNEEGKKVIQENRHITYVDCGAFSKCYPEEQNKQLPENAEDSLKDNVSASSNILSNILRGNATSIKNKLYSLMTKNENNEPANVQVGMGEPVEVAQQETDKQNAEEVVSLPSHAINAEITKDSLDVDQCEDESPTAHYFDVGEPEDNNDLSTFININKKIPKKRKARKPKESLDPNIIYDPNKALVLYPKPNEEKVTILTDKLTAAEIGEFPEEQEMITGTETEALNAGVDPSDIIFKCVHCDILFTVKSSYIEHCCLVKCGECGHVFKSLKSLVTHQKAHSRIQIEKELRGTRVENKTTFYCSICNDNFSIDLRNIHTKIHQENFKVYKCNQCDSIFTASRNLLKHSKIKHKSQPRFVCSVCDKICINAANLRNHMCTHTGLKPFKCKYCDKTFNRSGDQYKHERVHTGEKPNVCEICGKCFRVKSSLQLHMRSHTNERPYPCRICSKAFKSFSSLSFHIKSHGEARPYKCPYCEKGFKTLNSLHGHRNSHNKPFKCAVCDRSFAVRNAMLKHQTSMHQNEKKDKFDCVICGASYGRAWSLEMHIKTHGKLGNSNTGPELLKKMVELGSVTKANKSESKSKQSNENIEPQVKRPPRTRKKKVVLNL